MLVVALAHTLCIWDQVLACICIGFRALGCGSQGGLMTRAYSSNFYRRGSGEAVLLSVTCDGNRGERDWRGSHMVEVA